MWIFLRLHPSIKQSTSPNITHCLPVYEHIYHMLKNSLLIFHSTLKLAKYTRARVRELILQIEPKSCGAGGHRRCPSGLPELCTGVKCGFHTCVWRPLASNRVGGEDLARPPHRCGKGQSSARDRPPPVPLPARSWEPHQDKLTVFTAQQLLMCLCLAFYTRHF